MWKNSEVVKGRRPVERAECEGIRGKRMGQGRRERGGHGRVGRSGLF